MNYLKKSEYDNDKKNKIWNPKTPQMTEFVTLD